MEIGFQGLPVAPGREIQSLTGKRYLMNDDDDDQDLDSEIDEDDDGTTISHDTAKEISDEDDTPG